MGTKFGELPPNRKPECSVADIRCSRPYAGQVEAQEAREPARPFMTEAEPRIRLRLLHAVGRPMKRAEALQPLSREHLGALLVAKKLRSAEDAGAAAGEFLEFWRTDGQRHFRIEEEVLLPGWAAYGEIDQHGVTRMLEEHLTIRREALRLQEGTESLEQLHRLGSLLHDHVRFEERQLFVAAEESLDAAALDRLAAAIKAAEASY